MSKLNPHHLFRRGLFDPLAVCEQPLTEPCNANKTRIGCVLQDCCFFLDACYKKTVPGYVKVFYSLIIIFIILFWGVLGFWFYKYRKLKKKLADIDGMEESPAEIDTSSMTQEMEEQADTSQEEENSNETAIDGAGSTSGIEIKHEDGEAAEEITGETGLLNKEKNS